MTPNRLILTFMMLCFMIIPAAFSEVDDDTADRIVTFSGMVALEEGQYINAIYKQYKSLYRQWNNRVYLQMRMDAFLANKRLHIIAMPEIKLWSNTYPVYFNQPLSSNPYVQNAQVTAANAQGIVSIGDVEKPFIQIAAGVMPYKYNPDAHNLGEYLFRTGTHPPHIITEFDYPFVRLNGLRIGITPIENLSADVLLTTETEIAPLYDWSLSLLAGYKMPSIFDIGAGICFDRLFSANGDLLSEPKKAENSYYTENGDLEYYRFGGIKGMARLGFDFKGLLPDHISDIFGAEDGKIYAEAALLGITDYPAYRWEISPTNDSSLVIDTLKNYYGNLNERIPIMFGVNVPTFKLLDVLSAEFEYFNWPYRNSFGDYAFDYTLPIPRPLSQLPARAYEHDSWKVSVYFKRTLLGNFSIIGQVARDHTRHDVFKKDFREEEEIFTLYNSWGWWLKLQYTF